MTYQILMFFHVGSMFLATALAVGPSTMLFVVARSSDPEVIKRTFAFATPVFRVGGAAYGLGILFGVLTAMSGTIDLAAPWLVSSYVLVVLLIATNMVFERWTRRVGVAASGDDLAAVNSVARERTAGLSLAAMILVTLGLVFVMVVKPDILG